MTLDEMIEHLQLCDTSDPCSVNAEPIIAILRAAQAMRAAIDLATDAYGLHIANIEGDALIKAVQAYDALAALEE